MKTGWKQSRSWLSVAGLVCAGFFALAISARAQVNLLPNGSFERGSTGVVPPRWSNPYSGSSLVVTGIASRCGDRVLRVVDASNTNAAGALSDPIPARPGTSYVAEAYAMRTDAAANGASLYLKFYDGEGVQVGSFSVGSAADANTWDYLSVTGAAPATATSVKVLCYSSSAAVGTVYFDGVSLRESPGNPPPGAVTRYVAPAAAGSGLGTDRANPAKYNNASFWTTVKTSLRSTPVKVVFLEGEYVIDPSSSKLVLQDIGDDANQLTLEGQHPFGSVFTRTDAAPDANITSAAFTVVQLLRATNVVVRHLHWENDTTLTNKQCSYSLSIDSGTTGPETKNVSIEGCSFVGLSWNIYAATGFHHSRTHTGRISHCEFITGGFSAGFHMIYNAYGAYDLLFENNYFQDCAGAYLRLRAGCHEATVRSNEFVSTVASCNQPFIQMPTYNDIDPGDETWGRNFKFLDNVFNYQVAGTAQNVAIHFYHTGFDPYRSPGVLWDYLLTPAESQILQYGTAAARKALIRTNFGINFDTQLAISNNIRLGSHAYAVKLESRYTASFDYKDAQGVWHICTNYGGSGAFNVSDLVLSTPITGGSAGWNVDRSGKWDAAENWTSSIIPNGVGASAFLTNSITAARTNTLNTVVTLGKLQIGSTDGIARFVLEGWGDSSIVFDNSRRGAELLANTGHADDSIEAPLMLADDLTVNNAKRLQISGSIGEFGQVSGWGRGPHSLMKTGAGPLVLRGTNFYTGPTTVSSGALHVDGSLASSLVKVTGGATFGGNGAISGAVEINRTAVLAPGHDAVGTLRIGGSLNLQPGCITIMEINRNAKTNDSIVVSSVSYGGALTIVSLNGTFQAGDSYRLFSAAAHTGNFSVTNLPSLDRNLRWNWNPGQGVLSVLSIAAAPTNLQTSVNDDTVTITWPESHLGWYAQSNLVSLVDPAAWYDIPGSQGATSIVLSVPPGDSRAFYRLRRPY